jgi:hypothetical protein
MDHMAGRFRPQLMQAYSRRNRHCCSVFLIDKSRARCRLDAGRVKAWQVDSFWIRRKLVSVPEMKIIAGHGWPWFQALAAGVSKQKAGPVLTAFLLTKYSRALS